MKPKPWQPKYFDKCTNEQILVYCAICGLVESEKPYWLRDDWDMDWDKLAAHMKELRIKLIPAWEQYELGK